MFELFPNIKTKFPLCVAALDIETLGMSHNAAVVELGVVTAVFDLDSYGKLDITNVNSELMSFDVVDQVTRGRVIDADAYAFHVKNQGHEATAAMISKGLGLSIEAQHDMFRRLENTLKEYNEIWINGLSFDPAFMQSLVRTYEYKTKRDMDSLWYHHLERDTRTIYRTFPLPDRENKNVKHRAVDDAVWNLEIAKLYHQGVIEYSAFLERSTQR